MARPASPSHSSVFFSSLSRVMSNCFGVPAFLQITESVFCYPSTFTEVGFSSCVSAHMFMIHLSSEFFKSKAPQFVFITGCAIDMVTVMLMELVFLLKTRSLGFFFSHLKCFFFLSKSWISNRTICSCSWASNFGFCVDFAFLPHTAFQDLFSACEGGRIERSSCVFHHLREKHLCV